MEFYKTTRPDLYNGLNRFNKKDFLLNYFIDAITTLLARSTTQGVLIHDQNRIKKLVKDCFDLYVTVFNIDARNKNESPLAKRIREDAERKLQALDDTTKGVFRDEYEDIKDFVQSTDRSTLNEQEATKLQEFKPTKVKGRASHKIQT